VTEDFVDCEYEDLAELLAEMAAERGAPSDEDSAWAREALGLG